MIQPSNTSSFQFIREMTTARATLPMKAATRAAVHRLAQIVAANLGQIGQRDADDQRGLDSLA